MELPVGSSQAASRGGVAQALEAARSEERRLGAHASHAGAPAFVIGLEDTPELNGVRVKLEEPPLVLTDDNMVEVLMQCEQRLKIVLDAIRQEEEALVRDLGEAALNKPSALPQEPPVINNYRVRDIDAAEEAPSEEEFEEDLEEEVVDRDALKKQSGTILDKATKKTKKRKGKKAA